MNSHGKIDAVLEKFVRWQRRHYGAILLVGILLSALCFGRAKKLLTNVATDLIHLLPPNDPSVMMSDVIGKKLSGTGNLYLIVNSPSPEANESAVKALKPFLKSLELVGYVEIEKKGYDFLEKHKLLLLDLEDIYKIHDRLKEKIEREKLGGLFIDLEDDDADDAETDDEFNAMVKRFKDRFTQGVQSRYRRSDDGTVYVVDINPESADSSLSFYRRFGKAVRAHVATFDFSKYGSAITIGYAGSIKTRVEQYEALRRDIGFAGVISMGSIFAVLYVYYFRLMRGAHGRRRRTLVARWIIPVVPVLLVFIPMVMSTLMAFCFCSFFFDRLNIVTSFLFSIIFGLGVDIGIHLTSRFMQDRALGLNVAESHRNVVLVKGKSCATSILTTVASFYILTLTDFKGFSEFGWIAGNGLIVALVCYLLFEPCLILLAERWGLLGGGVATDDGRASLPASSRLSWARPALLVMLLIAAVSVLCAQGLEFEWNLNKLKMRIAETEEQKELLKTTINRVNRPASYLISTETESRKISEILRKRKAVDAETPTIQFFRTYYDVVPFDQAEKLALIAKIKTLLNDDALNTVTGDEKDLLDELSDTIARTEPVTRAKVPDNAVHIFLGDGNDPSTSAAHVMPLAELELDNGYNARAFYEDVGEIEAFGRTYHATSDSIVFARVLMTLFRDARTAIILSSLVLLVLIALHFRDLRKVGFVALGLASGIGWMLAVMRLSGLKLNFYNMIIIPATIGMGEDNSVHMLDRFEELKRRSIVEAWKSSGGAAFMASLTTMLGYVGLCFAHHPGLNSIGWMAITGMGTCLVGSLVVLPLLMEVFLKKPSAVTRA